VGIADGLGRLELLQLAVKGGPTHAFGLVDASSDAAIRAEALAALEGLGDGAVMRALALRAVSKTMGFARGEDASSAGLVEV